MGLLFNLALLIGGAGVFLSANGPSRVSAFVDDKLGSTEDTTPVPIDEGNELPEVQGPPAPGKETEKNRDDSVVIITLPGTNIPVAVPNTTQKPRNQPRNVQTGIKGKTFQGGGTDFIGGTVRETPITKNSTLSFIIDKLGVSASKAASIRTDLRGGLKNFDTGTNTGSGQKGGSAQASRESRKERLEREAEKAKKIFDSGSISNF